MATRRWMGDAPPVAQVSTFTPANVESGDIFTITINGKAISFTASAATVQNVVEGIQALLDASTIPEFADITWTEDDTKVTGTGTAGRPFTATSSATNGGAVDDQTFTAATPTAATGPNHWSEAINWEGDTVPVSTDDVVIDTGSSDILYGLDQSAVTLTSLKIKQGYTGKIGLPEVNADAATTYDEYRDTYLQVSATDVEIGDGDGNGSGRIKLDVGSNACTLTIHNTGTPVETGYKSVIWKGTHASNVVNITKGSLDVAVYAGETATIATLRVGHDSNVTGDVKVRCEDGVTLTTVNISGGTTVLNSALTTLTITGGECSILGSGAVTTINASQSAKVYYRSSGTLTTGRARTAATLDFSRDQRAKTVTNCEAHQGSSILDPFKVVTFTNGVDVYGCKISDLKELNLGDHITVTPSAI